MLFFAGLISSDTTQSVAQLNVDNAPSAATQTGALAFSSAIRSRETVSLGTGDVSVYIPLASISGRGGQSFTLAAIYDAHGFYSMQQQQNLPVPLQSTAPNGPSQPEPDSYVAGWQSTTLSGLHLSIPTLTADIVTVGISHNFCTYSGENNDVTVWGTTNFVFTDEAGVSHSFSNVRDQSAINVNSDCRTFGPSPYFYPVNITDSLDGSYLRLDTNNPADIVVYLKNGTQYHFGNLGIINNGNTLGDKNHPNFYTDNFNRIVDSHGNTFRGGVDGTGNFTITSDLNQSLTISSSSITYKSSDGSTNTVAIMPLQPRSDAPSAISLGSPTCFRNDYFTYPSPHQFFYGGDPSFTSRSTSYKFPSGDIYKLYLNSLGELYRIEYPNGGYTLYTNASFPTSYNMGALTCNSVARQIVEKDVYESSTAASSKTTYAPAVGGSNGTNLSLDMNDSYLNKTHYVFGWRTPSAVRETERDIYSGQNSLLRTVTTTYTTNNNGSNSQGLNGTSLPDTITTTLNDVSPTISSQVHYVYDTVQLQYPTPNSLSFSATTFNIDNPIEVDYYDYGASVPTQIKTNAWMKSGVFDVAGGHVLNMPSSESTNDAYNSKTITYAYYPSSTEIKSTITTGSDATSPIVKSYIYDGHKNLISFVDGRNNSTTYSYDNPWFDSACAVPDNSAPGPSSITNALQEVVQSTKYYTCTGLPATSTDPNGFVTTYSYDDPLNRITQKATAVGTEYETREGYSYPSSRQFIANSDLRAKGDSTLVTMRNYDGLGRVASIVSSNGVQVDTGYDLMGRVESITNAHYGTPSPSDGSTTISYDALGRRLLTRYPDGKRSTVSYTGNTATMTNENNKQWQFVSDFMGHLTNVIEPNGATTTYETDASGNLHSVLQLGLSGEIGRSRSFTYDYLSNLTTSNNPETGITCYGTWVNGSCISGYDGNGNLTAKTDSRGVTTTYSYDALNRLLSKLYSDTTPSSCYYYDFATNGVGRLANEITKSGTCPQSPPASGFYTKRSVVSYDAMGRTTLEQQCTPVNCTTTPYFFLTQYDLAGNPTATTSGTDTVSLHPTYDSAGRLDLVGVNTKSPGPFQPLFLFKALSYGPAGITKWSLSTPDRPAITIEKTYDSRLRPVGETATGHQ